MSASIASQYAVEPSASLTKPGDSLQSGVEVVREVRDIVRDLLPHRAAVYWTDFTVSYLCNAIALYFALTSAGWLQAAGVVAAAILMYRLSIFTHELSHMSGRQFMSFRITWNALFGIPTMMPLFMYGDHKSHHVNHSYGTYDDGEYFPLAHGPIHVVLFYFAQILFLAFGGLARFLFLAPLSLLIPPLRTIVWQRFSALVLINPKYRRPDPRPKDRLGILVQELVTSTWCWTLVIALYLGYISWQTVGTLYAIFIVANAMNFYRALGAHRYVNKGEAMSYLDQLLDSTTVEGVPILTEIVAPLGMRYHALHHLVPTLPYHAMPAAHRRLMQQLPSDSPYRETIFPSIWSAATQVARRAWSRGNF